MSKQPTHSYHRAQQLLFAFGIYRLILATALTVAAFIPKTISEVLPGASVESLQLATLAYLVLAVLGMLITINEQISKTPIIVLLITDILLVMLITRYGGGVDSGFGNLLLISVGLGGILLPLKQSLLIAAVATSSLIYTEFLPFKDSAQQELLQAALLGVGYFAEALFLQYVTQRMQSTEQLARAQADTILDLRHLNELIVQRMRTGIIVITADGAIRLVNDSARDLLGITEKRPFWLPKPLHERLIEWKKNPTKLVEGYQMDSDHPLVQLNFAKLQPTDDSDLILFVEDIGRVQQQAQQLKLASLGRLTASIAHEIRNPLGAISHAAQLLDEMADIDPADKRLLDIIHTHTERVNKIIETILDLSRKRPKKIESIGLTSLIEECINERSVTQEADQIDLQLDASIKVSLDVNQIKQVLHNIVDNGLRYSEQNTGQRRIQLVSGHLPDTEQLYLDIIDRGPGVPEEQIKLLFEPFYTTENSGTGLGLYIAKELCEANRLTLTYYNVPDGGCFRIIFSHTISQKHNIS
ncbi:ATP-binding protein [Reinekea marina]|uniref:histidine kinase n=1 Tax=Reinekea marina TaxID=1310421 RepID=A0ABV7WST2_9GAMM|nr:ATP-binding protein [Reinekea marina]MBU2863868.1 PAS domain-containing protein [Reinekea forsetii]MDN3648275.1 ATP-binding protein [Reinekea marina]